MAVASLVLGIISIIVAWIPFCNYIVAIPALVGLILGIVALVKANKEGGKKGLSIAGIVTSVLAIAFIIYYTFIIAGAAVELGEEFVNEFENQLQEEIENGNIIINEDGEYELSEDAMNSLLENIEDETEENFDNNVIYNVEDKSLEVTVDV